MAVLFVVATRRRVVGFLYPVPPHVFITASVAILALAYLERPVESTIAVVTAALGGPVYVLARRSRGRERLGTRPPPDSSTSTKIDQSERKEVRE